MLESPYTRYPVYRESLDDIVGVLHIRDLIEAMHDRGIAAVDLESIVRPAYMVPETKDLGALLDRVPAHEPAPGGRDRRVRLDGGDRHARGPARGDRRRDRGRVRPAGRDGRAHRRRHGADRRHVPDRRLQRAVQRATCRARITTRSPASSSACSAAAPSRATRSSHDGLHFQVDSVEGQRIDRLTVTFQPWHHREQGATGEERVAGPRAEVDTFNLPGLAPGWLRHRAHRCLQQPEMTWTLEREDADLGDVLRGHDLRQHVRAAATRGLEGQLPTSKIAAVSEPIDELRAVVAAAPRRAAGADELPRQGAAARLRGHRRRRRGTQGGRSLRGRDLRADRRRAIDEGSAAARRRRAGDRMRLAVVDHGHASGEAAMLAEIRERSGREPLGVVKTLLYRPELFGRRSRRRSTR